MTAPVVKAICNAMERIAPVRLAEKWDNVGLLLEAPFPRANANRILLTIDLTTAVTEEALKSPTAFIVSYHPTIFRPLSSLTLAKPLQANLLRCAASGISVYSPHTALDSVWGGINDWLSVGVSKPIGNTNSAEEGKITIFGEELADGLGGQCRLVTLPHAVSMKEIESRIKAHLTLQQIQVAYPAGQDPEKPSVQTIGICAGSGGSMLLGKAADVYWTGEMAHHEVLAAVANGHNVVLCGHTNTERGYLPTLAEKLKSQLRILSTETKASDAELAAALSGLEITVSTADRHPLQIV